jgi:protein gp37
MNASNIEWTNVTDNIITVAGGGWWCRRVSDGCDNCYAAKLNKNSFFGGNGLDYSGQVPKLELKREIIAGWSRQRKQKKHFVSSMTDVFGEWVPIDWHMEILDGMAAAPNQIFQLLTKRPQTMANAVDFWLEHRKLSKLPDNIWVGTTVESKRVINRVYALTWIPSSVRFLSCEPLLEDIAKELPLTDIQWVIVGGESGSTARPCEVQWLKNIVAKCEESKISVFVKQLGSNAGDWDDKQWNKCNYKGKGNQFIDLPEDLRIRQLPV